MNESEIVKMCVVLLPCVVFIGTAVVGAIYEAIRNRHSVNLFKDKEGRELLCYMRSEESK